MHFNLENTELIWVTGKYDGFLSGFFKHQDSIYYAKTAFEVDNLTDNSYYRVYEVFYLNEEEVKEFLQRKAFWDNDSSLRKEAYFLKYHKGIGDYDTAVGYFLESDIPKNWRKVR